MVHFGHVYDLWLELAHGTTCNWKYSFAQLVGKLIIE